MNDISNKIILKPWGYEYSVFEAINFSIWFLHIKENEFTSMHCHPKKTTKLILLDGEAKVSLLSEDKIIKPLDCVYLDRSQFHSTRSISKNGIYLFEIESPKDKNDLVRLTDKYGRENIKYEFDSYKISETQKFSLMNYESKINFAGCSYEILNISSILDLTINSGCLYVVLSGIMYSEIEKIQHELLIAGDVIKAKDLSLIRKKITSISQDCKLLVISKA